MYAAGMAGGVALVVGVPLAFAAVGTSALWPIVWGAEQIEEYLEYERVVARVRLPNGPPREVRAQHVAPSR